MLLIVAILVVPGRVAAQVQPPDPGRIESQQIGSSVRLYLRPLLLKQGATLRPGALDYALRSVGIDHFDEAVSQDTYRPGTFFRRGHIVHALVKRNRIIADGVRVHSSDKPQNQRLPIGYSSLVIAIDKGILREIFVDDQPVDSLQLVPDPIATLGAPLSIYRKHSDRARLTSRVVVPVLALTAASLDNSEAARRLKLSGANTGYREMSGFLDIAVIRDLRTLLPWPENSPLFSDESIELRRWIAYAPFLFEQGKTNGFVAASQALFNKPLDSLDYCEAIALAAGAAAKETSRSSSVAQLVLKRNALVDYMQGTGALRETFADQCRKRKIERKRDILIPVPLPQLISQTAATFGDNLQPHTRHIQTTVSPHYQRMAQDLVMGFWSRGIPLDIALVSRRDSAILALAAAASRNSLLTRYQAADILLPVLAQNALASQDIPAHLITGGHNFGAEWRLNGSAAQAFAEAVDSGDEVFNQLGFDNSRLPVVSVAAAYAYASGSTSPRPTAIEAELANQPAEEILARRESFLAAAMALQGSSEIYDFVVAGPDALWLVLVLHDAVFVARASYEHTDEKNANADVAEIKRVVYSLTQPARWASYMPSGYALTWVSTHAGAETTSVCSNAAHLPVLVEVQPDILRRLTNWATGFFADQASHSVSGSDSALCANSPPQLPPAAMNWRLLAGIAVTGNNE